MAKNQLPDRPASARQLRALPAHLAAVLAQAAMAPAGVDAAAMAATVAGIQAYQRHAFVRVMPDAPVVWRGGVATLRRYAAEGTAKGTVLVVPSLINGVEILDLLPDRSFVRCLAAAGYDVLLLDWGRLAADVDLDRVITENLLPAAMAAAQDGPVHGVGYCMGGTLLAAAACLAPSSFRSLTLLASPWDFAAGDQTLANLVRAGVSPAAQVIAARGVLPADWIQTAFAALNADRTAGKFSAFAALDPASPSAALFVAVEDWLNDGRDLPGGVAMDCVRDWYVGNRTGRGVWTIGGLPVDTARIAAPVLLVASMTDRLVPRESALALLPLLRDGTSLIATTGHIGMMSGHKAMEEVWRPVLAWLDRQG